MQQRRPRSPALASQVAPGGCPACGGEPRPRLRTAHSAEPGGAERVPYRLATCAACSTAWVIPADRGGDRGALHAQGAYAPLPRTSARTLEPLKRLGLIDRLRFVPALPPGARVFEVGAGDGRLLNALARRGYTVAGAEPYRPLRHARASIARERVEDLALPTGSQEVTVLWHVLEHLDDPAQALRRVRAWTAPGGIVVAAVPNAASLQARVGGDRWFQQDVPRHLVQFTPAGLTALLSRTGFSVRRSRQLVFDQALFAMWQTLLNRLTREPNVAFAVLKGGPGPARPSRLDLAVTAVGGAALAPVAVLLEVAAALRSAGGCVVVEAEVPRR